MPGTKERIMKAYLEERMNDLRQKYRDTGDSRWLHRFNECKQIKERLVIDEITKEQEMKHGNKDRGQENK